MGRRTVPGGERLPLVISTTIVTTKKTPLLEWAREILGAERSQPEATQSTRKCLLFGAEATISNKWCLCLSPEAALSSGGAWRFPP